ncbi:MAG: rRNA pseudouridine synthase [Lachnospiraceae bacterium]|nr:rRNA pseudouridine synthase [Lachnospiraceae bacterium]
MRLDKYLTNAGIGTRSQVKKLIKARKVMVSGEIVTDGKVHIDENLAEVSVNGEAISFKEYEYYMLNKPQGVVSATSDNLHATVISLIKSSRKKDLFPVGRLDIDTEGLLLITNDGEFSHNLLSPKKHVDKTYFAIVLGNVTKEDIELFQKPMDISGKNDEDKELTKPAKLILKEVLNYNELEKLEGGRIKEIISKKLISDKLVKDETESFSNLEFSLTSLTISEGKFHQVKRMFLKVNKPVVYLKRLSMGDIVLDPDLKPGEYKEIEINK